jgi:multidrug efflux pump subunit AcrB
MMTRYLFRNPQIVWLIVITLLVTGVSCLYVMPRLEDPVLKPRVGVIGVTLPGADATELETSVVVPIEEWLQEFADIKKVRSNTRANVTNIVVELADRVAEPDTVWSAIERKLQANSIQLPDGCSAPELTIFPLKAFAAILAVKPSADQQNDSASLRSEHRIALELKRRLLGLSGTESVEIFGAADEELAIRVAPELLAATGLSTGMIANQIADSRSLPGGDVQKDGQRMSVEVQQDANAINRLQDLPIELPGTSKTSRLGDLASVTLSPIRPRSDVAIVDGRDAIVLGVMVDNQKRVDLWTDQCRIDIDRLLSESPEDFSIEPLFLQSDQIRERMDGLLRNLAIGTLAVVAIVFLFMGWRCMLVVAVTLPLSACVVVFGLRTLGIPIHQMSVTGLIVSLGLLIDNAIVMVEEVRSRIFQGKQPLEAITEATGHLRLPLLGSTLTTILTFLPIAMMPGPSGEFVGSLAISVILAISASLILAFTIVPPMVAFLGIDSRGDGFLNYGVRPGALGRLYRKSLEFTFRAPILGVLLGVALPVIGFWVSSKLPKQFFPATDRAQIQIELDLPTAANLESLRASVDRVSQIVRADSAIKHQHWFLGRSAPTFYYNVVPRRRSTPNYAQAFVDLESGDDVDSLVNRLQKKIDAEVLDARVVVRKLEQGPPFDAPVELRVLGEDIRVLEDVGNQLRGLLASHPQVTHTRADLGDKDPRLKLVVDSNLAAQNGVSDKSLSRFLFSSLQGTAAGEFVHQGRSVPARVLVDWSQRSVIDSLMGMPVAFSKPDPAKAKAPGASRAAAPVPVSLGAVADFRLDANVGTIIRHNGHRVNEVKAYLRAGVLPADALATLKEDLRTSDIALPAGYRLEIGGESEKRSEAISTLIANVAVIVALMIITLVAVLGSVRLALVIASVAGLVMGLAPLTLHSFGYPFGFMAIVGTMGLIGVAINDSIVVLAALREKFLDPDAVWDVDQSVPEAMAEIVADRTRHILATTVTTMIGFLPLVLDGGKFWPPLAIVMSVGVGGATLLALYFTPSLYLLLHPDQSAESD